MKCFLYVAALTVACLGLTCCAPTAAIETPGASTSPATGTVIVLTGIAPATVATTPPVTATAAQTEESLPKPTNASAEAQPRQSAATELVGVLEQAAQELRAAESDSTLAGARMHAEGTVNLLVGKFGRWYGDQDGDEKKYDPSNGRGVLPGEIVTQGADLDQGVKFPAGLALMAAGTNPNPPALAELLGDTALWRSNPRAGYDAIAAAVQNANPPVQLDTLKGSVPRAVAFARLILTKAKTVEDAHALATSAVAELDSAVREARTLTQ